MKTRPRVSIAVPVYNGENYLQRALDSVSSQSFDDYELIVVDNASTDSTAAIVEELAEADDRVRYHRNDRNIGIHPNFDRCVGLATGEYFCWLAHDDEFTPDYIARCVEVLDQSPEVVLVHSLVQIIDASGDDISVYDSGLTGSDSDRPHERFRALTHVRHTCTAVFGLFRLAELKKTQLMRPNHHAVDRSLLAEISLLGRIRQIDEPLFRNREHTKRYVRHVLPSDRVTFHQRDEANRIEVSQRMLMNDYKQAVERHISDAEERARCRGVLRTWWLTEWNLLRFGIELAAKRAPWFYDGAKWLGDRVIKPKHPTVSTDKRFK